MNDQKNLPRVANSPAERPLMIFDGDCGFCRYWIARWRHVTAGRVDYEPWQKVAAGYPEIPQSAFETAVQLVDTDGRVFGGADAVFRALDCAPRKSRLAAIAKSVPGFHAAADAAYRVIAKNRMLFSFLTRFFFGRGAGRADYSIARWIFPRLVGLVYLIAFLSLRPQVLGLAGEHGISPAARFLKSVEQQQTELHDAGTPRHWLLPTVCWYECSDRFLVALCVAGAVISCVVIVGLLPVPCLFLLWLIYLSLMTVCQPFLNFQWDILLLETGFLTIFLAPIGLWTHGNGESWGSRLARWLLLWLLFSLMFESGVVKLTQGDDSWSHLTSLTYHYETQPLPLWTSWYLNQEPRWFEKLSMLFVFASELAAPFLIFGPRTFRRAGCAVMVLLQLLIAATGNYCFFNLLTIFLCLLLLDDDAWPAWIRRRLLQDSTKRARMEFKWPFWAVLPIAVIDLFMSCQQYAETFTYKVSWPKWVTDAAQTISSFGTFNSYGLFRQMTRSRPEIIIEGSNDGEHWLPYEFKWKPGDVNRRPALVAPFQPRLDWQMWFAALGEYRDDWFVSFLLRLKEGSPEVLSLMGANPFPDAPPRYMRASMYLYHFTRAGDDPRAWWKREFITNLYTVSPRNTPGQ